MIRLPLLITKQELPPKPEPWTATFGKALFVAAIILAWEYVLGPAMDMWLNG
jgi:hypothetical protein